VSPGHDELSRFRPAGPVPRLTCPVPTHEFALYSLGAATPAVAVVSRLPPFSPARYSRYKYGSVAAAEAFARDLATAFLESRPELARAPRLLLASSPYARVPAAATTLARHLQPRLNAARARYGLDPAPLVQIERAAASAGDYGTLSAQARDLLMAANALSFRRFKPAQVRGAHLLVVDDVRVTGAHQRCLMRASEALPLAARAFLYVAAFAGISPCVTGSSTGDGRLDPALEDALNHAAVKTLDDLAAIVEAGDFTWNVRACKFALNPGNRGELPHFLRRMPGWFVRGLYRNSRDDGYARMPVYAPSHAVVRAELSRRSRSPLAACPPA
jgi:hypothetical protein